MKKQIIIQGNVFEIESITGGWWNLAINGEHYAKLVDEEECRRVIWLQFKNKDEEIEYLTALDFNEVQ